jgi:adenylate cyclase
MGVEDPAADELEIVLLQHHRRYTSRQVAELAGVPVYRARRFWRALGFANVGDDAVEFTDADLDALVLLLRLVTEGLFEERHVLLLARSLGRATARLAESQAELSAELLDRVGVADEDRARVLSLSVPDFLPDFERLLTYTWRRQLAASVGRVLQTEQDARAARLAVGFADLVGFTRLSRRLEELDLARLVDRFEGRSADMVTAGRGRVIKTLGDSVMFVADSAQDGAEIALQLVEVHAGERTVPPLRVGVALGPVLARMGDVFGSTVNLASRLTSLAAPDQVLVDARMAADLAAHRRFQLSQVGPLVVHGFDEVTAFTLARRPRDPGSNAATPSP